MTEAPPVRRPAGSNQLLIDLGPIVVFVVAFNVLGRFEATKENAVYIATGIFIAATLAAMAYCKLRLGRIPPVLMIVGVFVTIFGGLTILLHDRTFIQIKPTFVYAFYTIAILVSFMLKQNVWKLLFGHAYALPDRIWNILALRWAGFFAFMAVLNEILRATLDFDAWLNSRPWVVFPLIFGFALLNAPLVMKHAADTEDAPVPEAQ
jgi:intracellular septation protein